MVCFFVNIPVHYCDMGVVCFQFKRHKSLQHTTNFAKSVVNLVDAVSSVWSFKRRL